jgi:hypothetical protein
MITEKKKIEFVVTNFHDLENRLLDCLSYVPYVEQNRNTISPKFIPIILESCSLIESIFKDTLGKGKFNFKTYSQKIDSDLNLNSTISILLTSPIQFIEPFKNWINEIPAWWSIYNKLKHDRLNNFHLVTYDTTVLALTALHQLISKHRAFTNHIIERSWIPSDSEMVGELICARMVNDICIPIHTIPCESELFVSPLGGNFVKKNNDKFYVDDNCEFSNRVKAKITISEFEL